MLIAAGTGKSAFPMKSSSICSLFLVFCSKEAEIPFLKKNFIQQRNLKIELLVEYAFKHKKQSNEEEKNHEHQ